ncbi:MAG: hypothetical protein ACBZ72_01675 [Candidatus Bathyarchaeia archaeon]
MANSAPIWFPTVFPDKCDGCAKTGKPRCVEYCPNNVFSFQNEKAYVTEPLNCVNGCRSCESLCHQKAISFPNSTNTSRQAENKKEMLWKTTCEKCGKKYWTNRQSKVCMDCEKR